MSIREEITARILQALLSGVPPWRKGWTASGLPLNASTNKRYRGVNVVLLGMQGHADPRWITYRQAKEAGYQVRKGERSTKIVRLVEVDRSRDGADAAADVVAEENNRRLVMRIYDVFNAEQVDGLPALPARTHAIAPVDGADAIVEGMKLTGLKVLHGSPNAYYSPHVDTIRLPEKADFHSTESYYFCLLHEISHSTGAAHRLNRDMTARFGTPAYAREELRAEIASAMSAEVGIPLDQHHIESHAAYISSWIAVLESDPFEIFRAAGDAQGICDYMQAQAVKIELQPASDPNFSPVMAPAPARPALRM